MKLFSYLLDLFYPGRCVFCRRVLEKRECAVCAADLPVTACGGRQEGEYFDFCISPLYYSGMVRSSILRFKFGGCQDYAKAYGQILAGCVGEFLAGEYDIITAVPLSAQRRRERGYDQAMLLAQQTAALLGGEAVATLRKTRNTRAQSAISNGAERRTNVTGAYELFESISVAGERVLLIDDVITTGATLSECSRVLLAAGAGKVLCATLARGVDSTF